jgi:CO/xanthine dehydrogenase Mo-binding subunit
MLPAGPLRSVERRTASGIGLAIGWHGAGFTGSGEVYLASVASVELTAEGAIRVLTANTEMGQGTKTVFPQMVATELGVPVDWVEYAPQDTAEVLDSGPTVARAPVMVVGGLVILAARKLKAAVEARHAGVPFHEAFRDDAREHGATRIDQKFEPYPGVVFDDATYMGDAVSRVRLGRAVATVEVDLDTFEVLGP